MNNKIMINKNKNKKQIINNKIIKRNKNQSLSTQINITKIS